jgi:heme exporter protein A
MTARQETAEWLLELEDVRKVFGAREALRGISLKVQRGEVIAVFGPNGAGKTTLLRTIAMLVRPSSGAIRFLGLDLREWDAQVRRLVGLVSHQPFLQADLSAAENLWLYARLYETPDSASRVAQALERVGLATRRHDLVRAFSRGMQQRLSIARVLLYEPALLLLDEPYTGLDPQAATLLEELIAEWREKGRTVILTSHDLERGARFGGRVLILRAGRIAYEGASTDWQKESLPDFRALYERCAGEARL